MLISLVHVPCIRACNFLIMYNFLGLGGGIGFKSYQIYVAVQTVIIHRSWSIILFWLSRGKCIILIPIQSTPPPSTKAKQPSPLSRTLSALKVWYLNSGCLLALPWCIFSWLYFYQLNISETLNQAPCFSRNRPIIISLQNSLLVIQRPEMDTQNTEK